MDIEALKTDWFFDDVTPRGISFDGFLPQACKTPLGNVQDFELIHTPKRMAGFQHNSWNERNPALTEVLTTVSALECDKHVLVDKYKQEIEDILNLPCDLHEHGDGKTLTRRACRGFQTLKKDLSRYMDAVMAGNKEYDEGKLYDVKKEIYRLTDRIVCGLAKCFNVQANGAFEAIDKLFGKKVISSAACDNIASASAIGLKLRISTYLKVGKQGEELTATHRDTSDAAEPSYHMPRDEELFHFFYVAIPLYKKLNQLVFHEKDFKSLSQDAFFDCRDLVKASIYTRVLSYTKAVECYERALKIDAENVKIAIRQLRLLLIISGSAVPVRRKLDVLLEKIFNSSYTKDSEVTPNDSEIDAMLSTMEVTERRQLLEILMSLSSFQPFDWYFKLAERLFDRCIALECPHNTNTSYLLLMDFAISNFYVDKISNRKGFAACMNELSTMIEKEGVSTKGINCLNKLAEFFLAQGEYGKSYKCLQRALAMEHALYGSNPNLNVMKTLYLLGMISIQLFMLVEGQYFLEQLLKQFDSFKGLKPRLVYKQAYLQLATLYSGTGRHEEALSLLTKGVTLTTDRDHAMEQNLDCIMYCEIAKLLQSMNNCKEAKKSIENAKNLNICLNIFYFFRRLRVAVLQVNVLNCSSCVVRQIASLNI